MELIGERPDIRQGTFPLSDERASAIGERLNVPIDTARLVYCVEYQTSKRKRTQTSKRRFAVNT